MQTVVTLSTHTVDNRYSKELYRNVVCDTDVLMCETDAVEITVVADSEWVCRFLTAHQQRTRINLMHCQCCQQTFTRFSLYDLWTALRVILWPHHQCILHNCHLVSYCNVVQNCQVDTLHLSALYRYSLDSSVVQCLSSCTVSYWQGNTLQSRSEIDWHSPSCVFGDVDDAVHRVCMISVDIYHHDM